MKSMIDRQKEIYCNKNQILKCFCNHEECCSKRTAKCLDWINYFNFSDRENYQTYCSETKIEWKHCKIMILKKRRNSYE